MLEHPCKVCGSLWHSSRRSVLNLGHGLRQTVLTCPNVPQNVVRLVDARGTVVAEVGTSGGES